MAIITFFAIGTAIVGAIAGVIVGLVTAVIGSILVKSIFSEKRLPFNWAENVFLPIGGGLGIGIIAGYIVGMVDSFNESTFVESSTSTVLWSLIGLFAVLIPISQAYEEQVLERQINLHPQASEIYSQILYVYKMEKENARDDETIYRLDVMKKVMEAYGISLIDTETASFDLLPPQLQQPQAQMNPIPQAEPVMGIGQESTMMGPVSTSPPPTQPAHIIDDRGYEWISIEDGSIFYRQAHSGGEWIRHN